jgi:tetratricopeptide (TPR) repeat protein
VLLPGEPGIGKSRIAAAALERLQGEPHTRLRYFCSPHHQATALHPFIRQLEHAAGFEREDAPERKLDKLEALLAPASRNVTRDVALVADLLSVPSGNRYPRPELNPQQRKEQTFSTLLAQLDGLASRLPVLMVFEDAHWIDPTSLELLERTIDRLQSLPALLIVTARPEFAPPWTGRPQVTVRPLNRLTRHEGVALIEQVAGGRSLPKEIEGQIIARTDGVPLFIEELTKAVLESGVLRSEGDRYVLTAPLPSLAIPTTLHGSLMARLDRLSQVRKIAEIGAAIGREFSQELIGAVSEWPETDLNDALDQLVASELVYRRGTPPDALYTFKHALVQEAAYESLLKTKRRSMHRVIAEALAERAAEGVEVAPEILAHHHEEAGAHEEAARQWLEAGRRNARRSANSEAIQYFERAIRAIRRLPSTAQVKELELELHLALIPALMSSVGFAHQNTAEAADRALVLCEEFGATDRLLPILFSRLSYHTASAQLIPALEIADRILRLGQSSGDTLTLFVGHRTVGFCHCWMGNLKPAEQELDRALRLAEGIHRKDLAFEFGHDLKITGRIVCGGVKLRLGHIGEGRRLLARASSEAKDLNHPLTLATLWKTRSIYEATLRNYSEVQQTSLALQAICAQRDIRQFQHIAELLHLWAEMHLGSDIEPSRLVQALERHRAGSFRLNNRRRASNLLRSGSGELAEQWLRASLERAREQQARIAELCAARDLARIWAERGEREMACDLLAPVYGWFTEGFDTPDLKEAKALLDGMRE